MNSFAAAAVGPGLLSNNADTSVIVVYSEGEAAARRSFHLHFIKRSQKSKLELRSSCSR